MYFLQNTVKIEYPYEKNHLYGQQSSVRFAYRPGMIYLKNKARRTSDQMPFHKAFPEPDFK